MNEITANQRTRFWSAEFFSAKDFVRHAGLLVIVFAVVHFCGLREFTSFLNGTTGSLGMDPDTAAFLGVLYVFSYLAAILGVPVLLIAAGIIAVWQKIRRARRLPE